jgi:hypothetical protein
VHHVLDARSRGQRLGCLVPLICRIDDGDRDGVSLDGLNFILVVDAPAVMGQGGWRVGVYIDERADDRQREALGAILSGAEGGAPEIVASLVGEQLGVKFVPIEYESSERHKRVVVPGIMEFEVEAVTNPGTGEVIEVTNTVHPMGADLPIAKSIKGHLDDPDFGLSFDNTGKNGHYRAFAWAA